MQPNSGVKYDVQLLNGLSLILMPLNDPHKQVRPLARTLAVSRELFLKTFFFPLSWSAEAELRKEAALSSGGIKIEIQFRSKVWFLKPVQSEPSSQTDQ